MSLQEAEEELSEADVDAAVAVCWHSQQAAEKALKAALIVNGIESPRTHNLVVLRALLRHHLPRGSALLS